MKKRSTQPINVAEYESRATRLLSKMTRDYFAGGSEDETTLHNNCAAFSRVELIPRVLREIANRDLTTKVLGEPISFPALVAPIAFNGLAHRSGERAVARATAAAGTIMIASVASNTSIEDLTESSNGPIWFQVNIYKNRDFTRSLVTRAEKCGCKAIVVTVDAPVWGLRERDIRNQFHLPKNLSFANFKGEAIPSALPSKNKGSALAQFRKDFAEDNVGWSDVKWLRSLTKLPVVLKGIQHPEDAKLAIQHGIDAIIVSNHGGRQLDTAAATIDLLPPIADAVGGKIEVLLDGGVRRGSDILKALAYGARAVGIGRPVIWGLTVAGESGVSHIFEILKNEFSVAMALAGCKTIAQITRDFVR